MRPASPAENVTILGISTADISRLGGTWPPDGTRTIAARSVPPATSTIKGANSLSEEDLMQKRRERLQEYLSTASSRPPSAPTRFLHWPPASKKRTPVWSVALTSVLTEQDIERVNELRPLRLKALTEGNKAAFRAYSNELYALTGKHGYTA